MRSLAVFASYFNSDDGAGHKTASFECADRGEKLYETLPFMMSVPVDPPVSVVLEPCGAKAIYGKLGVSGQVGLLSLVHHSAILLMASRR